MASIEADQCFLSAVVRSSLSWTIEWPVMNVAAAQNSTSSDSVQPGTDFAEPEDGSAAVSVGRGCFVTSRFVFSRGHPIERIPSQVRPSISKAKPLNFINSTVCKRHLLAGNTRGNRAIVPRAGREHVIKGGVPRGKRFQVSGRCRHSSDGDGICRQVSIWHGHP